MTFWFTGRRFIQQATLARAGSHHFKIKAQPPFKAITWPPSFFLACLRPLLILQPAVATLNYSLFPHLLIYFLHLQVCILSAENFPPFLWLVHSPYLFTCLEPHLMSSSLRSSKKPQPQGKLLSFLSISTSLQKYLYKPWFGFLSPQSHELSERKQGALLISVRLDPQSTARMQGAFTCLWNEKLMFSNKKTQILHFNIYYIF